MRTTLDSEQVAELIRALPFSTADEVKTLEQVTLSSLDLGRGLEHRLEGVTTTLLDVQEQQSLLRALLSYDPAVSRTNVLRKYISVHFDALLDRFGDVIRHIRAAVQSAPLLSPLRARATTNRNARQQVGPTMHHPHAQQHA